MISGGDAQFRSAALGGPVAGKKHLPSVFSRGRQAGTRGWPPQRQSPQWRSE